MGGGGRVGGGGGGGGGTCVAFSLMRAERIALTPAAHMAARASSAPVYERWPGQ